jgi:hypothetical protein
LRQAFSTHTQGLWKGSRSPVTTRVTWPVGLQRLTSWTSCASVSVPVVQNRHYLESLQNVRVAPKCRGFRYRSVIKPALCLRIRDRTGPHPEMATVRHMDRQTLATVCSLLTTVSTMNSYLGNGESGMLARDSTVQTLVST